MTDKQEERFRCLKRMRELMRHLLVLKYGEQWQEHNRFAGKFFANPLDEDKELLTFLLAFADGDTRAIEQVKEWHDR